MILFFIVSAGRSLILNDESGTLFQSNDFSVNGLAKGLALPMLNGREGILSSENFLMEGGFILSARTFLQLMVNGSLNLKGLVTGCEYSVSSAGKGT